jgi:hypothetical protein
LPEVPVVSGSGKIGTFSWIGAANSDSVFKGPKVTKGPENKSFKFLPDLSKIFCIALFLKKTEVFSAKT